MDVGSPDPFIAALLSLPGNDRWAVDTASAIPGVTLYAVRSFDGDALRFSLPVLIRRPLPKEIPLDPRGANGAVAFIIERIKQKAETDHALGPLAGRGTRFPQRYASNVEPYTLTSSPAALASDLWHADTRNFADDGGIHVVLCGAVPYPEDLPPRATRQFCEQAAALCDAVAGMACTLPARILEPAWVASLDQQLLRESLPSLGLVAFVGDGARPARQCTQYRSYFRTAGPKSGVNIPFACPKELGPVEIELPASHTIITGLGIKQREVFAVAGSNAQGKTTFLEGIVAGQDDHAAGDGRELIVTVRGVCGAEATGCELAGADVSMFFSALPPGMEGTVKAAYGAGSGSMTMAAEIQDAVARSAPLLIIDEDRAAANLLAKSCLQGDEVTPLAEILAGNRGKLKKTALVFAACAMDTLIAQANRIMVLERHAATAIDRDAFRRRVVAMLEKSAADLA